MVDNIALLELRSRSGRGAAPSRAAADDQQSADAAELLSSEDEYGMFDGHRDVEKERLLQGGTAAAAGGGGGGGGGVVVSWSLARLSRWAGVPAVPYDARASTYWTLFGLSLLSGAVYGYGLSLSPLLDDIAADFADAQGEPLSTAWKEAVSGAAPLGGIVVTPLIGLVSDRTGRLWVLVASAVLFCVGMVVSYVAHALWLLLVARFIVGVGMAMVLFAAPCYVSENTSARHSEVLVGILHMLFSFGFALFCAVVLAAPHHWRQLLLSGCAPGAAMLLFLLLFAPESVGWRLRGQPRQPAAGLVRGDLAVNDGAGFREQHQEQPQPQPQPQSPQQQRVGPKGGVYAPVADSAVGNGDDGRQGGEGRAAALASDAPTQHIGWWRAFFAGNLLAVCNAADKPLVYYAAQIFKKAGWQYHSSTLVVVVLALVSGFSVLAGLKVLRMASRRPQFLAAMSVVVLAYLLLVLAFGVAGEGAARSVLSVAGCILMIVSFQLGPGVLFLVIASELFPPSTRGLGVSINVVIMLLVSEALNLSLLTLFNGIGTSATFALFGTIFLAAGVAVFFVLPETRGIRTVSSY